MLKEHIYVKVNGVIFSTGHIQCKQSLSPISLDFEKTLKIELFPIPQAYTLKRRLYLRLQTVMVCMRCVLVFDKLKPLVSYT
jgi:hypothetical protein